MVDVILWTLVSALAIGPGAFGLFLLVKRPSALAAQYMDFCQRRTVIPLKDEHFCGRMPRIIASLKLFGICLVTISVTIFYLVLRVG